MNLDDVLQYLSTARAEFRTLEKSVLDSFVVPFYLEQNNLSAIAHSVALAGGRGCGKTTYLRYFSHWTQFDKNKKNVVEDDLNSIVLYWKPDTVFCRALRFTESNSRLFFLTLMGLEVFDEIRGMISNLVQHFPQLETQLEKSVIFWETISHIAGKSIRGFNGLEKWIRESKYTVQSKINSNDKNNVPNIDPKALLNLLLPVLRTEASLLAKTKFKIFVDEFENLSNEQQKIINTYRKHSDASLSWNVAHKTDANITNETDGDEPIQEPNDYRTLKLDVDYEDAKERKDYNVLSSEILLLSLQKANLKCNLDDLTPAFFSDRDNLERRRTNAYRKNVLQIARKILPTPTIKGLAEIALENKSTKNRIHNALVDLDGVTPAFVSSLLSEKPEVAVTAWSVCNQRSFSPSDLINYANNGYKTSDPFYQKVETYLYSALLSLNIQYSYIDVPVYAGINRYFELSKGNIRHFIELCYQAIKHESVTTRNPFHNLEDFPKISFMNSHAGAKSASEHVFREIPSFSPMGQTLYSMAKRLGDMFQIIQRSKKHSEPEQCHFFVRCDYGDLGEKINEIFKQAKCWKVLLEHTGTKDKNPNKLALTEYQLNPIYAPKFGISYRRKKRTELTLSELNVICTGSAEEYTALRDIFLDRWDVEYKNTQQELSL